MKYSSPRKGESRHATFRIVRRRNADSASVIASAPADMTLLPNGAIRTTRRIPDVPDSDS